MRHVIIYVEGSKDAYFLHELILRQFGQFPRNANGTPKDSSKKPFALSTQGGGLRVEIYWTDGYGNLKGLAKGLHRPKELLPSDEFVPVIVYDSDTAPIEGPNDDHAGHQARRKEIHRLLGLAGADEGTLTKVDKWIFLFPDNEGDGDLEDALLGAVLPSDEHSDFFERCWKPFVQNVEDIPANRPTDKSMMNEYKAAFNAKAWEKNGLNLCYGDERLWDWSAASLRKLVDFLSRALTGPAVDTLDRFLP